MFCLIVCSYLALSMKILEHVQIIPEIKLPNSITNPHSLTSFKSQLSSHHCIS